MGGGKRKLWRRENLTHSWEKKGATKKKGRKCLFPEKKGDLSRWRGKRDFFFSLTSRIDKARVGFELQKKRERTIGEGNEVPGRKEKSVAKFVYSFRNGDIREIY